ncbi:MAG: hypothetical protein RLZZ297_1116 [Chloroflexota bacterium]|jgi:tRNA threonylcarbamoyladenosine biosynthesis protein TsaB
MILAIDTSGSRSGLALCDGDRLVAECQWQSGRRHSEQLLPQLDALCRLVAITPAQIRTVAVALGPGSWSGIRVGISIAKGLALATDATVIGVATLDALAWATRGQAGQACVALGRGRYAVAAYPASMWLPGSVSAENVAALPTTGPVWCDTEPASTLADTLPASFLQPQWARPLTYAQITHWLLTHPDAPRAVVEPIYLGDPVQRQP